MKCFRGVSGCVGYSNGECHSIENCKYQDYFYNSTTNDNSSKSTNECSKKGFSPYKSGNWYTVVKIVLIKVEK